MSDKVLRLPKVLELTGMGRSWTYREIALGRFPAPIKLGARAVGWREAEVLDWISTRAAGRFH